MNSNNKVAIVTGGAMGIGLGIAKALAKEKYQIVVADIKLDQCKSAALTIQKMGVETLAVKCDVSKKSEVDKLFAQTIKKFGRLDVLVNNAGVYPFVPFAKMTEAHWDKVMDINLKGVFLCSQQAVKNMKQGGRIINISDRK
ncbi:MAG: SDR family oxidoreductase, partial [Patescibacteria group bacterium]